MPQERWIDPISDPEWLAFVEGSPSAEVFHHPRWLELLRSQYGYELQACCVGNGGGIEAGIPLARVASPLTGRRLVSLPFSDYCPPALARHAPPAALDELGRALAERSGETGLPLSVRASMPSLPGARLQRGFTRHVLPLAEDPAEVEKGFSKSQVRRGIAKARREGLRAERRTDVAALDAFYSLHVHTRRRLGVPTQPKRFIRRFTSLFEAGLGFVGIVLDGDRPIAAAVFLTHGDTLTYKYGASDAGSLKKRPNNLLFSEAIRWACEAGLRRLDFGRTETANEGLRSFKRSWGAAESDLAYTHLADRAPGPETGVADRVMGTVIRRSPPIVGRVAGAALYRHFG